MLAVGFEEDVEVILENFRASEYVVFCNDAWPSLVSRRGWRGLDNPLTIDLVIPYPYFFLICLKSLECQHLILWLITSLSVKNWLMAS